MDLHGRGNNSTHIIERRTRTLTDEDIEALANALHQRANDHITACRFGRIDPDKMERAIEFCERIIKVMDNSASLAGRTILVLFITAAVGSMFAGFIVKIKDSFKVPLP